MKAGTDPKSKKLNASLAALSEADRTEVLALIGKHKAELKRIILQNTKDVLTEFVDGLAGGSSARSGKRPRRARPSSPTAKKK